MRIQEQILKYILKNGKATSREVAKHFGISRQYAQRILKKLTEKHAILKEGSTRSARYIAPNALEKEVWEIRKRYTNTHLAEHEVLHTVTHEGHLQKSLPKNVYTIFEYAFSEMLNNAIEHSKSQHIVISAQKGNQLQFHINDTGIGVFRNIMQSRRLQSELEAMQDLLKGKTTTQPKGHSGEGIFFTSKIADVFSLESFGYKLTMDNIINDIFFEEVHPSLRGTKVFFQIACNSHKHLMDIFAEYQTDSSGYAFDKTEVQIKLYTMGMQHISRSQARRVLAGLEKFKSIILDFDQISYIGQAFADEIFRVFQKDHPSIRIIPINMNTAVKFMVERVEK